MRSTYDEPTVMWRVRHSDGRSAHAVIVPLGPKTAVLWFILGSPQESREFNTLHGAIRWVERQLVKLQASGWRLWEPPEGPRTKIVRPPDRGEQTRR